jgi:mannose-6-phosphate isomerase-like protein (cupin superfamily)
VRVAGIRAGRQNCEQDAREPPTGCRRSINVHKINLAEKLSLIHDHWNPRIAGELNGQLIKLVKFEGPFTWHHHENEDEMFLVVKGRFRMDYRDHRSERSEWIEPGEFIIVPRGIEHRPCAEAECEVLLFEPASTLNTGNIQDEFTRPELERI